jgi:hypothetical protein
MSRDVSQSFTNGLKCLIYNARGVSLTARDGSAATLRDVRLAAAVTAESPRRHAHQGAGR